MRLLALTVIISLALAAVSVIASEDVADQAQQEGEMAYYETAFELEELAAPEDEVSDSAVDVAFDMSEQEMRELEEYNAMDPAEEEFLMKMLDVYANDPDTLMKLIDIEEPIKDLGVKGRCSTRGYSVTCRATFKFRILWKKIKFSASITGEYIPSKVALRLSIQFNGRRVYSKTISARNPPSMCFPVPHTAGKVKGCLKISRIQVRGKSLSSCFTVEARVFNKKVASKKLKCMTLHL